MEIPHKSGIQLEWGFIAVEMTPMSDRPTACILLCDDIQQVDGKTTLVGVDWASYIGSFPRPAKFWVYVRLYIPYSQLGTSHRFKIDLAHEDIGAFYGIKEMDITPASRTPGAAGWFTCHADFTKVSLDRPGRYSVVVMWDGSPCAMFEVPFSQDK